MREIKFRACDDRKHYAPIMLDFEYLKTLSINQWSGFKVMQYTGLEDKNGVEVWEGDLRKVNGKLYKIVGDGWRFRLERNMMEFGENHDIVIDEDTAYESILIGNIHENPELLKP